jgi:hypothetical protein
MELADFTGHRALLYVATVTRHGHPLTVEEFNAFVDLPLRMRRFPGAGATSALAAWLATRPTESILDWLTRLGWLAQAGGNLVTITPLGSAVLAGLEEAGQQRDETPTEILLAPDDELSYARVIGLIAQMGRAALVDPFFSIDSLLHIVQRTQVDRILIKPGDARTAALGTAVATLRVERPLEVRASDTFHDRFVIPGEGPVRFIGTSLNGVGKRLAVTGQVSTEVASAGIRQAFEEAWANATVVASAAPEVEPEEAIAEAAQAQQGQGTGNGVGAVEQPPAAEQHNA